MSLFPEFGKTLPEGAPFVCDKFGIFLFSAGEASVRVNGNAHQTTRGTVMTLMPGEIVELETISPDCAYLSVSISMEAVIDFPSPADSDIMTMAICAPVFNVPEQKMSRMTECYNFLESRYGQAASGTFRGEILKSLFYVLALEVCDAYRQYGLVVGEGDRTRREQLNDEFFRLLSRDCSTHRSVAYYADLLHITPKYLSREIRRITGRTVQEWISRMTIFEMKRQLSLPGRTIMQISEEMNFSSPSAFVQFFKLHTGITPLKYRKTGR